MRSGVRRRIAGAGIVFGAVVVAALIAATSAVPAEPNHTPIQAEQADLLDAVDDWLSEAEDANEDGDLSKADDFLKKASQSKRRFIKLFAGQKIYGCELSKVIRLMETIDISLAIANETKSSKDEQKWFGKTYKAAKKLSKYLGTCAQSNPGFMESLNEDRAELVKKAKALDPKADYDPKEFTDLKESMISDTTVYGCEVWALYTKLEAVDRPIDVALNGDFKGEDGAEDRDTLIHKARNATVKLMDYWNKVPCEEEGGTGGGGGETPPTIDFIFTPPDPVAGEPVSFSAFFGGGAGTNYTQTWDFGDGTPTVTGANPSHVFSTAGTFTVTVTATDGTRTTTVTHQVTTHFANCTNAPTAGVLVGSDPLAGPPGSVQIQLSAQCQEFIRAGAHGQIVLAPAGKDWYGYNSHTDSPTCGNPGPGVKVLECDIKPDGTVCWHLYGQPDLAAGDVIIYRIRKDGVTIAEFPVTVQSSVASECTP